MNVCHCQTQYCGAEWAAEEEKDKKKSEEKNLGRNYTTSRPTDGMPNYSSGVEIRQKHVVASRATW